MKEGLNMLKDLDVAKVLIEAFDNDETGIFNKHTFRKDHLKINVLLVTANTFCLFLLGLSTNKITFHQDAASYHLNNQAFIRSEKVILGFSNFIYWAAHI